MADWDERYRRGEHASDEPGRLLVRAVENLPPGSALDIACGAGRHALYLAARGWRVVAVDASRVGIELTRERARRRGVEVETHVADLERGEFPVEREAYDLICVFYYLQRDLFAQIRAGVRAGGAVVAAIHLMDVDAEVQTMNPAFLLQPSELRAEFSGWQIEHYHETQLTDDDAGEHQRRTAEIIAIKK
jgi:SAM-dependent methyltransferase